MQDAFDWKIPLRDIPEQGRQGQREATPRERAELASALDVLACDDLSVTYEVHPLRSGIYRLTGRIRAGVVQACVVTLEPVPARLDEPINVELRPADMMPVSSDAEQGILDAADIEPLDGDDIDLGLLVLEHISTALDPYPRKAGVEFEGSRLPGAADANPFAALAILKGGGKPKTPT
jgi:hypothetical protein